MSERTKSALTEDEQRIVALIESHVDMYPTDVFPEESEAPDAVAASVIRWKLGIILEDIRGGKHRAE